MKGRLVPPFIHSPTGKVGILESGAAACLVASFLVPDHYSPWTSIYNEALAALAVLLLIFASRRHLRDRAPDAAWVVVAVATIPAVQLAIGLLYFSGDAWVSSLYIVGLGVSIAAGSAWAGHHASNATALLARATTVAAALSSVVALLQVLHSDVLAEWIMPLSESSRATANLGQPNNLATLLGVGALSLMLLYEKRLVRRSVLPLLILLLVASALTQSRTSLFFGPLVVLGLLFGKGKGIHFKTRASEIVLAALLQWLLFFLWPIVQSALLSGSHTSLGQRGIESVRLQMWPMLLKALSLSPWYGYGWLQVGAAELAVVNDYPPVEELWLHGHNLFLELLLWNGYPLGLLMISVLLYWYVSRLATAQSVDSLVGMLVVTLVGVHAMLEFPLHYAYFLILVGLWAGVVESARRSKRSVPWKLGAAPLGFTLLVIVGIACDYPTVQEDLTSARFESLKIGPSAFSRDPKAASSTFLSALTSFAAMSRTKPEKGMSARAMDDMRAAVERYPYAPSLVRLALVYALNGRSGEAVITFKKIRQLFGFPTYWSLREQLVSSAQGELPEVRLLYESLPTSP